MIDNIKVRMYRQGFGDCFLLQYFEGKTRMFTMLIDCGLKFNDSVPGVTLKNVRDDIAKELKGDDSGNAKPKLDVLVITHEHWDHVSAFHPDEQLFDEFSIGKLWFAWTENPLDDDAKKLNKTLARRIKALEVATRKLKYSTASSKSFYANLANGDNLLAARQTFNDALQDVLHFFGPLGVQKTKSGITVKSKYKISLDTRDAIDHVRSLARKRAGITYFEPGTIQEEDELPGIRFYILGPPKNKLLTKDKPSAGAKKEVYLGEGSSLAGLVDGLLAMGGSSGSDDSEPFASVAKLSATQAKSNPFFKDRYFESKNNWRTIEHDWLDMAGGLALQMDSDTNNTSLVLAIEFVKSGKVLLFPGDAQVGNWLSWHEHEWKVEKAGRQMVVTATDLLKNTVFYKAGHHLSHNATLKALGLELMNHKDLVAFVPEKNDQYNGIPHKPLVRTLKKKTKGRMIFSADKNYPPEKILTDKPEALSEAEWKSLQANLKITKLFIEYTIKG